MQDETETTPPPDTGGAMYSGSERTLAAVMLVGLIGLAYICTDVLCAGRLTRALTSGAVAS